MKIRLSALWLLGILVLAVIFRFYNLNEPMVWVDEPIYIVGGIKLLLQDRNLYDPSLWNFEHPPLSKYLIGITTTFAPVSFDAITQLPPNYYVGLGNPNVAEAMDAALTFSRSSAAVFGVLLVLIVYLFARNLYGEINAIPAGLMAVLSVDLLAFSRNAHLDIFLFFFSTLGVYLFYKFVNSEGSRLAFSKTDFKLVLNNRLVYLLSSALAVGLSLLTKTIQPFILLPVFIVLYFVFRQKISLPEILIFFLISIAVFFIGLGGNLELYSQAVSYFGGDGSLINFSNIINSSKILLRIQPALTVIVLIAAISFLRRKNFVNNELFAIIPAMFIILSFILTTNQHYRYFDFALPFLIIFSARIFSTRKAIYYSVPLFALLLYTAVVWSPDYLIYTNLLDELTGRSYFWSNFGFTGFSESANYLKEKTTQDDLIFSSDDAIRYRLSRNLIVHENGRNTVYLVDGRFADLESNRCPTIDDLKLNNVTYAVVANPISLGDEYCSTIKDLYRTLEPVLTVHKNNVDVMKVFKLV